MTSAASSVYRDVVPATWRRLGTKVADPSVTRSVSSDSDVVTFSAHTASGFSNADSVTERASSSGSGNTGATGLTAITEAPTTAMLDASMRLVRGAGMRTVDSTSPRVLSLISKCTVLLVST